MFPSTILFSFLGCVINVLATGGAPHDLGGWAGLLGSALLGGVAHLTPTPVDTHNALK